ncbi:hypothetical protein D3C72_1389040 [compost metagenome]
MRRRLSGREAVGLRLRLGGLGLGLRLGLTQGFRHRLLGGLIHLGGRLGLRGSLGGRRGLAGVGRHGQRVVHRLGGGLIGNHALGMQLAHDRLSHLPAGGELQREHGLGVQRRLGLGRSLGHGGLDGSLRDGRGILGRFGG